MPRICKDEAPVLVDAPLIRGRYAELEDYTVSFETFPRTADGAPAFRGLPGDRCQCPHWGVVLSGQLTLRYADREETYHAGDVYYAPPGHTPQGPTFFEVSGRFDSEALPLGLGNRSEIDFETLQEAEDLARIITLVARPQVLAKQDPLLHRLSTILLGQMTVRTLREVVRT